MAYQVFFVEVLALLLTFILFDDFRRDLVFIVSVKMGFSNRTFFLLLARVGSYEPSIKLIESSSLRSFDSYEMSYYSMNSWAEQEMDVVMATPSRSC